MGAEHRLRQIDGLPENFRPTIEPVEPKERIAHADAFFANTGADVGVGESLKVRVR
ncbi:hypothetical protein [Agrobacterium sp. P15N1-A]|uniref:hypothetical protein n=1 Tax=Agrobacterium sp. P15N1-A TaxID=3342820 RepID=UPI0037DD91B1